MGRVVILTDGNLVGCCVTLSANVLLSIYVLGVRLSLLKLMSICMR